MGKRGSGEGSIFFHEPSGRWCTQVSLGYVDGKRKRKTIYGATRKEVSEQLKIILREQQQGKLEATGKQTMAGLLTHWLAHVRSAIRSRTYESYETMVRLHITPAVGRYQVGKLKTVHIAAMLQAMEDRGLAARTRRYARQITRMALDYAIERGLVHRNVAVGAPTPRMERHEVQVLSPAQARRLLDAAIGDRLEALYSVALGLGLRQGESLGLHWRDVDLDAGTLLVRSSLQRTGGRLQFVPPKTEKSRRTLSLPAETITALRAHRLRQMEEHAACPDWHEHGLVFCTPKGTPIEKSGITKRFALLLERAGLPPMRFHDLRHSCASILLAQGVPLTVVQHVLGHSSITVTGDIYAHLMPTAKQEAAAVMDGILSGKRG